MKDLTDRDLFQFAAFRRMWYVMHKKRKIPAMTAFVIAICDSNDIVFDRAIRLRPTAIAEWKAQTSRAAQRGVDWDD